MLSFNLVRWLKSLFRARVKTIVRKPRFRLCLETLEDRLAPAQFIWTGAGGNTSWSTTGNWLGNAAPSSSSPSNLADLVFDNRGSGHLTSNNDLNGLLVNSIQISALNNYAITGNLITLGDPSSSGSGTILVASGLTGENIGLPIQLAATNASQQFFTINSGAQLTLSGQLSGTTGSQLTKEGTGTLTLTNDNAAFTGPFNIDHDAGIVIVDGSAPSTGAKASKALGGAVTSTVETVKLTNPSGLTKFNLTFGASTTGTTISYTGTQADAVAVAAALNGLASISGPGGSVFVTQANTANTETFTITLAGSFEETSQGQITGSITAGPGSLAASTLIAGGAASPNLVTVNTSSQLQISKIGAANPIANSLKLYGAGASSNGSLFNTAGTNVWSGPVAMGTNTSFNTAAGTTLSITGGISDLASPFNVTKIGQGTLIFANANSYRGSTTVADGILDIQNPQALGSVPSAGTSVVRSSTLGTIGTLRLEFNSAVAPTGSASSTYWTLQNPAQAFNAVSNPYIGFVVNSVPLTLNAAGFGGNGALQNLVGNNTWTGTVTLGSAPPVGANVTINVESFAGAQTRLFLTGVMQDVIAPYGPFNLTKIGTGDLVLSPTNSSGVGTPNLFKGTTLITDGTVTLRDSQGLGPQTKRNQAGNALPIVTVNNGVGAALHLESNVGHVDSITNATNRLQVAAPLSIDGPGYNSAGALESVSGINTYTMKFVTSPTQNAAISGPAGMGSLALNTTYNYVITAIDGYGESLASNEKSFTTPAAGTNRAITLSWSQVTGATGYKIYRSTTSQSYGPPGNFLVTTINSGATTTFDDLNSPVPVAGSPPTVFPVVSMFNDTSIGVEPDPNPTASNSYFTNDYSLTITGGIAGGAGQLLTKVGTGHLILPNVNNQLLGNTDISQGWITIQDPNALGGPNPSVQEVQPLVTVDTGGALMLKPLAPGTSFTFSHNLSIQGLGITHPFAKINQQGAVENLAGVNTLSSNIKLVVRAGIGVEQVDPTVASDLSTNGEISGGGLVKLGSQRLDMQGPGIYTGGVDIQQGVVRVQNDTALGAPGNSGTTVEAGAALELANTVPDQNGNQTVGASIWGTRLILNGTGNSTFGDATLAVLGKDNLWHGPISLNSAVAIDFEGAPGLSNQAINTLTASSALTGGGSVTVATTTPGGGGLNAVQTLLFNGIITGGSFTLTYNDGVHPAQTTGNISWSSDPNVLIANITNQLSALSLIGAGNFGVSIASPVIDIDPNSRLIVTGVIDDAGNRTTNGADLLMNGGGSLVLAGNNTYRGATLVNQGILTLQNGQALGGIGVAGQQEFALTSPISGTTQFTLTYPGAGTTASITYQGNASDATTIQTRLGTLLGNSNVSVVQANSGVFLITFTGALAGTTTLLNAQVTSAAGTGLAAVSSAGGTFVANKAQLQLEGGITVAGEPLIIQGTGNNVESAVQTYTVGTTALSPTGTYSLNFNGASTGALPYNATAGQVQAALQNLSTVKNVGGQVLVNVGAVFAGTNEEQRMTFKGYSAGDTYQLYWDPANGAQQLGYNLTPPIVYGANPFTDRDKIVAALGKLQTVTNLNGSISGIVSSVAVTATGEYVAFLFTGGLADQPVSLAQAFTITGGGANPVVTHFIPGAYGTRTFNVEFQGAFAGILQPNLTLGAGGVTGSATLSTPATTIIGGSANATPIQWFAQGPAPITGATVFGNASGATQTTAGRVTGIDVQQGFANDLYISTADGGFWRTIDGGAHWTPVFDSVNSSILFGGAVTIAQTSNSLVYFGTGEGNNSADSYYGSGVYSASTRADSATTFTKLLTDPVLGNPLAGLAISKIVVNPSNTSMIWVATSDQATNGLAGNAGIWRYDGVNWLNLTAGSFPTSKTDYSDVAYDSQANVLYAGMYRLSGPGNSGDILASANPDAVTPTFTGAGIGSNGNIKLAVSGKDHAFAAVTDATLNVNSLNAIYSTADDGATWKVVADVATSKKNIPEYLKPNGQFASAIAVSGSGLYVGGTDQGSGQNFVLQSTDGGANWIDISKDANNVGPHSGIHSMVSDSNNNLDVGTDGGVWRYNGKTWANLNGDLNIANLTSVSTKPGNPGVILAGTQANGLALFNGSTWTQVNTTLNLYNVLQTKFMPGNSTLAFANFEAPNKAFGTMYNSQDTGATWTSILSGANIMTGTTLAIDQVNSNRVLGGTNGRIIETLDGGATTNDLVGTTPNTFTMLAAATFQGTFVADPAYPSVTDVGANTYVPDTIYTADSTHVEVTKDHAATYTGKTGGIGAASNTSPIVITNNGHGLSTGQIVTIRGVAGNTAANGTFTITVIDANNFSLNGSAGNGGPAVGGTWTLNDRTPPLLPGTTIQDIEVDPANSNVAYVVTSGAVTTAGTGRVFKTVNSGQSWTDISAGLPLSAQTGSVMPAWKLLIDSRAGDLYLGTDEGVFKQTGSAGNWQQFGAGLPIVQVKDLDLNTSANVLTVATYGRGVWQFYLDDNTLPAAPTNPGALRSIAGNNSWTGPITLAGPTTISANGSQALQNGLSASTLTLLGTISDARPTNANTLTKVGAGDVTLAGTNTYAGVTDIQQGNVIVKNPSALGGSALAGVQALSIFTTPAPVQKTPTIGNGASTLASGATYYYEITALGPQGESIGSNEQNIPVTAANQQVSLSWAGVAGATGYKVYRSTVAGTYGATSLVATIPSAGTVTYTDTGTAVSAGTPPILQFTLTFGSATTAAIPYTGIPATDAASIGAVLTPAFFTSAGYSGSASVSATGAGLFLITLGGGLAGTFQPSFTGAITSGFGSASVTSGGGTIVENGAALELESSLFLEPVTLNTNGIQPNYSGHYTGALRSLSNANTFTGNVTLNTNATIGVDAGSTLTVNSAAPITLTSANHGLQTGYQVTVAGVVGNTAANGTWTVTALDANHFALNNSTGNAPYASGGTWTLVSNITAATTPTALADIVITSPGHGLATGNLVTISGVLGDTAANGTFTITKIDNDTFSLNGTNGLASGAYTGSGLWLLAHAITGAANANPIVITSNGHGLSSGQQITITGVLGNTNANGSKTVTFLTANTFSLSGPAGNGTYTANTGAWTRPAATGAVTGSSNPIGITDNGLLYKLEKEGAGALVLASPDTYGNPAAGVLSTTVDQGILNIQNSRALGVAGSTTTVRDGAQLQLQTSSTGASVNVANENLVLSGSGISGTGALLNVAGNNTWGSPASTLTLTAVPGFAPATTPAGTVVFGVSGATDTLTIGSAIVEPTAPGDVPTTGPLPTGLVKVGPGRVTLTQSDAYTGTTYVTQGALRIQNSGALGANAGNDIQRITTFDTLGTDTFTLAFNGQTTGLLTFGVPDTGGVTPSSSLQNALAALSTIGSTANVSVARQTITLNTPSGTQTGYAYTVTFVGAKAGLVQPLIVATPSGGLKISATRVADGGIGTLVSNGASLELDGSVSPLSVPASETLVLNGAGSNASYSITAASEASGATTVIATVASTAGLTTGETVTIAGFTPAGYNGTFAITVIDATHFSYAAPAGLAAVTVLGSAAPSPGALHNVAANNTWAGAVILQSSSSIGADPATQLTVLGTVKDPTPSPIPPADLTKVGTGTLVFPGANTYSGNTFINTGALNIRNNGALGVNTSAVQNVSVLGSSGTFTLVYNGTPISPPLNFGATALQVQNALNAIVGGGNSVTVTQLGNTYTVFFNGGGLAATAQPLLTGTGTGGTTVTVTPILLGAESDNVVAAGASLQIQGGVTESSLKPLFLNGAGSSGAGALENVANNNSIAAVTPVILQSNSAIGSDVAGSVLTLTQQITDQHQVQTVNLSALASAALYTLTFNGLTTGSLTYDSAVSANNVTAIQSALNGLATITLEGGSVVVAHGAGTTYTVTFGGRMIGVNWPAIVLTRLSDSSTASAGTSMVSAGSTIDKVGSGTVQYTGAGSNLYTGLTHVIAGVLQLNKTAGLNAILGDLTDGTPGVAEVQTLTITGTAGTFGLTFNGQTTGNLAYNVPASGGVGATASVQNALNALSTIGGVGGAATVTQNTNVYTITFGGTLLGANLPQLTLAGSVQATPSTVVNGSATANEVQAVAVTGTSGAFTLTFNGQTTGNLAYNVPASGGSGATASIQNALNALSSIGGLATPGSVTVTQLGSVFTIVFGGSLVNTDVPQITSAVTPILTIATLTNGSTFSPAGSAVTQLLQANQIANTSNVLVNGDGLLDLNSNTEDLGTTLKIVDGQVKTGDASLVLLNANALNMTGGTILDTHTASPGGIDLQGDVTATSTFTAPATITGSGNVNLDGATRTFTVNHGPQGSDLVINSVIADLTGASGLTKAGTGRLELGAVNTYAGATQINTGDVQVDTSGVIGSVSLAGGSISGKGNVGAVTMLGSSTGTVDPGYNGSATPYGVLHSQAVTWNSNTTFFVDLRNSNSPGAPVVGADYDQLNVTGAITLGDALLAGSPGAGIQVGDSFTIIQSTVAMNPASIASGTVPGNALDRIIGSSPRDAIPQDGTVFLNGQKFTVHYNANSVVLTRHLAVFTSFTIAADHNASVYGQEVTYTVTAVPENGASLATAAPLITFNLDSGLYTYPVFLNSAGVATYSPQSQHGLVWAPGINHTIAAHFTDANNVFAPVDPAGSPITQAVNKNTVNVAASSAPVVSSTAPVYGQPVNVIATVTPVVAPNVPGASNPTNNVKFVVDAGTASYIPINPYAAPPASEAATLNIPASALLTPGAHTVAISYAGTPAAYAGDANYAASAAATNFSLVVQPDASVISFTPAPTPSTLGTSATFNLKVGPAFAGSPGQPVGTLNLYDGAANLASNTPLNGSTPIPYSSGTVSFSTTTLALGVHNIIATFTPNDSNYTAGQQNVSFTVNPATTSTTILTNYTPAAPTYGQQVQFNFQVSPSPAINSSFGLPTGNVTLWDGVPNQAGSTNLGTGAVSTSSGQASVTTLSFALSQGAHTLYAVYSGDGQFGQSTGTLSITVAPTPTHVALQATPASGDIYGASVQLTATVTADLGSPPAGVAAGKSIVTFVDLNTSTTLGTADLISGGTATINTTALIAASHSIKATYTDTLNTNFATSNFTLTNYVVSNAPTSVSVLAPSWSTSPTPPVFGQPVTLTAKVLGPTANNPVTFGAAGSKVTFWDGAAFSGTNLGSGIVVDNLGNATFTTSALSAGAHTINASYSDTADTFFLASNTSNTAASGAPSNFSVNVAPTAITLFVATPSSTTALGQQVTYNATVKTQPSSTVAPVNAGTVVFLDNGNPMNGSPVTVNSATGVAAISVTYSTAAQLGSHTISATYKAPTTGQINYADSPQVQLTQNVLKASNISVSPVANAFGQDLVYNVTFNTIPANGSLTGTVVVTENGNTVASSGGTLTNATSATITIAGGVFNQGTHNLVFTFTDTLATPVYASSFKQISQVVAVAGTQVVFNPTPQASITYGNTVTYAGVINTTASGGINPTAGNVNLYLDSTAGAPLTSAITLSGSNTFNFANVALPANVAIGSHTIYVTFTPASSNYSASQAFSPLNIAAAFTGTTISSSSPLVGGFPQSHYGEAITFSAVVKSGSGGVPDTGTTAYADAVSGVPLTFYITSQNTFWNGFVPVFGTVTRSNNGTDSTTYSITTSLLPTYLTPGYQVQAYFLGNAHFAATPVPQITNQPTAVLQYQKVAQAVTTTSTPTSSLAPSYFGQSVTFTATATAQSGGTPPTSNGYMRFYADGTTSNFLLGYGTLVSTTATTATYRFTTSSLSVATHSIYAQYVTDNANFAWSADSSSLSQIVNQAKTQTVLVSSPARWASDVATTFTANIYYAAGYAGSLSNGGQVVFTDSNGDFGPVTVTTATPFADHVAFTFTTPAPLTGGISHTITAKYTSANPNIAGSQDQQTQFVKKFSNLALAVSASTPLVSGHNVTFNATLTDANQAPIASKNVTFTINGNNYNATTNSSGVASVTGDFFQSDGSYPISVSFAGDATYNDALVTATAIVGRRGRLA